jgi:hypothetical protein
MSNSNAAEDGLNPTLRNYYRLAQQQDPASSSGLMVANQPPPSNQIAENLQALQNQDNISKMSRLAQYYLQQGDSKPKMQSSFAERKQRAETLMLRINRLKKPLNLEKFSSIMDTRRILQTLLNTEHIEN